MTAYKAQLIEMRRIWRETHGRREDAAWRAKLAAMNKGAA